MSLATQLTLEQYLLEAQSLAIALFNQVEQAQLIRPGLTEQDVSDAIFVLAERQFGVKKHWHKRIVRAGANTLKPYAENPPDQTIQADDIVFLDFGPIFEMDEPDLRQSGLMVEADLGRTFVVGNDPEKHKLNADLAPIFNEVKAYYQANPRMTGAALFAEVVRITERYGWIFGGPHAGHLIGEFPHEMRWGECPENYICPDNHLSMAALSKNGEKRHWILEIHLVNPDRTFGGFYEQLLSL